MPNTEKPPFTQEKAQQIWKDYLQQVNDLCGLLDKRQKTDILMELKTHLLESYIQLDSGDEVSRITAAINKLGQPAEFIPLWVEERLLDGVQPGSSTRNLVHLLKINAVKGMGQFLFSMMLGLGYLLSFYFLSMSILKFFFPVEIGLYLSPTGIPLLGYVVAEDFTELLGYWLIPLGLAIGIFLPMLLNQWLRRRISRNLAKNKNQKI